MSGSIALGSLRPTAGASVPTSFDDFLNTSAAEASQSSTNIPSADARIAPSGELAASASLPSLTFAQINTLLEKRDLGTASGDVTRIFDSIISKPSLYTWLTGSEPNSLGPVGRGNLAYFINSMTDLSLSGAQPIKARQFVQFLDSIATSLWSGLPGLAASPTDAQRVQSIGGFFNQLSGVGNAPAGSGSLTTRQLGVGLFAESIARNARSVEGADNLPAGSPSIETIANQRIAALANAISLPNGTGTTFRSPALAAAIPNLMAGVQTETNKIETLDAIIRPLTQQQSAQIAAAIGTPEFLRTFSFQGANGTAAATPGSLEKFFVNLDAATLKDKQAQIFESVMVTLDSVPSPAKSTLLGALTNVILQDPTTFLFRLYKEDNIDTTNFGNPNGRAFATYLKNMIEGEQFSDLKASASLMTVPPNYTVPLNADGTTNVAQLNADQLATFSQSQVFSGRVEYPSVDARAYFIGSFGRALTQLTSEGKNVENLSKSFANTTVDATKTVVGFFLKGKTEKLLNDLLAVGTKAIAPSLFGNPSNAQELLLGLNTVLTPRDPNNTDRPLPGTYVFPETTFAPLAYIATESARLRDAAWGS